MGYRIRVTEHAEELLDNLVGYLLNRLKSEQAARHLLDGVDNVYDRLEENPFQFPNSRDAYLGKMGYREAIVPQMDYIQCCGRCCECGRYVSSIGELPWQIITEYLLELSDRCCRLRFFGMFLLRIQWLWKRETTRKKYDGSY